MPNAAPILRVRHLVTRFDPDLAGGPEGRAAVDDVSFDVPRAGILGLLGESGSGKSLTALSILRLLPPGAHSVAGTIEFDGKNLLGLPETELRSVRGRGIAMIFQEPSLALSSVHTVGEQLAMALQASGQLGSRRWFESSRRAAQTRACELLARVELPDAKRVLDLYPHQLSAGMRRRVMIALGVACRPRLLIADEPTTGLDAPIQAQILDLLVRLVQEDGMSMIFITHDLCVVAEVANELVVLSAGQVVEAGPARQVLDQPQHAYTASLLDSIPGHRRRPTGAPRAAPSGEPESGGAGRRGAASRGAAP